jgi:hypothetical protein
MKWAVVISLSPLIILKFVWWVETSQTSWSRVRLPVRVQMCLHVFMNAWWGRHVWQSVLSSFCMLHLQDYLTYSHDVWHYTESCQESLSLVNMVIVLGIILGYYTWFGWQEIVCFRNSYIHEHQRTHKRVRTLLKFSLAALIITYQPRVAVRSLWKENGDSGARGTMVHVGGLDRRSRPTGSPHLT